MIGSMLSLASFLSTPGASLISLQVSPSIVALSKNKISTSVSIADPGHTQWCNE